MDTFRIANHQKAIHARSKQQMCFDCDILWCKTHSLSRTAAMFECATFFVHEDDTVLLILLACVKLLQLIPSSPSGPYLSFP